MRSRFELDEVGDTLPSPGRLADAPEGSSSLEHSSDERACLDSGPVPSSVPARGVPAQSSGECLSDDTIVAYRQGGLSATELDRIDRHLDSCDSCRELVEIVIADEPDELMSASQVTTFQRGFIAAGRYEILSFLGKGGMGEVYAALDQLTGKKVALKTVVCTATDDVRAVRKLFDEVLNAQRVAHPHVFKIYDLHEHRDALRGRVPLFTMEFIEGESLGGRLRRDGSLRVAEAAVIARQLLEGLAAAHSRGVLHLDFKSDNVMLRQTSEGFDAVVMDFGLSRAPDAESRQRTSERLQLAGTLPYMSIEQLECQGQLGPASDVYSFGVVLYEMLTGQLPFRGESYSAILLKQLRERPARPSSVVPGLSRAVDAFVLRCLESQPRDRFEDAGHALRAIEALERWHQPARVQRRGRGTGVFALAVVVAGAAAAVMRGEIAERAARDVPPETFTGGLQPAPVPATPAAPAAPAVPAAPVVPSVAAPPAEAPLPNEEPPAGEAEVNDRGVASGVVVAPEAPAREEGETQGSPPPPARPGNDVEPSAARRAPAAAAPSADEQPPSDWRGPPPRHVPRPRPL
jgi:hypothetical protein